MSWEFAPAFDAAHRASLETGKSLVYVCPPAAWAAAPLFARVPASESEGLQTLILIPGTAAALACWETLGPRPLSHLHPLHVSTGLARTERLLRAGSVRTLITTANDALELTRRAALKLEGLPRVAIAWPEAGAPRADAGTLDTLLGETATAQRLFLTENPGSIAGLLERHARRAPVLAAAAAPEAPGGPLSYAVVDGSRIPAAVVSAVDALNPASVTLWGPGPPGGQRDAAAIAPRVPGARVWEPEAGGAPADLLIALDLPSASLLAELRTAGREVVVFLAPWQLSALGRLAAPVKPLRLTGAADHARDRVFALRQRLRARLEEGGLEGELLLLEPLFEEHDPALVAAATLALGPQASKESAPAGELPAWVRVRLNLGRRADIRVADLVGALLNGVRVARDDVGKVDLHDGFALVDVRPAVAEQVVRELSGMTLRGRRLTATIDRR